MQAGKDVYVEKPCSHNIWEGRQLVDAARKYKRMCQHGTQGRSSPAIREAIQKLREGVIGEVYMARGLCFKWRPTIGHTPDEPVPPGVDYDLWLGPAPQRPFNPQPLPLQLALELGLRQRRHGQPGRPRDGHGPLGPGRGLAHARSSRPAGSSCSTTTRRRPTRWSRIFEYPEQKKMLVFEVRHWITNHEGFGTRARPTRWASRSTAPKATCRSSTSTTRPSWARNASRAPAAKAAPNEYERFIAGVRSRKIEDLGVDIEDGHLSSALCHLGNIAYRLGRTVSSTPRPRPSPATPQANAMLTRDYRKPYVVPKIA